MKAYRRNLETGERVDVTPRGLERLEIEAGNGSRLVVSDDKDAAGLDLYCPDGRLVLIPGSVNALSLRLGRDTP